VRGELRVVLETDFPQRFDHLRGAYLVRAGRVAAIEIRSHRPHQGGLLMMIGGVDTRQAAEDLRGSQIAVTRAEAMPLGPDHYYVFEIIGLRVRTTDRRPLGVVTEVIQGPANDTYVVRGGKREILIPAVREFVRSIDRAAGEMVVVLPDEPEESTRAH
jgi:16S rRNA processing protein RimM